MNNVHWRMKDEATMTIQLVPRAYEDARDLARIRDMHIAGRAANNGTYYVHCGDLDWWFNNPPDEADRRESLRLWEAEGKLLGWCLHMRSDHSFDFFAHPDERGSERAMAMLWWGVAWATERARAAGGDKLTNIWINDTDNVSLQQWGACGFVATEPAGGPIFMQSLGREIEASVLPAGFAICDARTEDDFRLHAEAMHGAFGIERPWDAYWQKRLGYFHSPAYAGEHNLVVRSPDGHGTAACIIWLDHTNKVGLFEPVGTHPHFQKMGLGKAVMREGLRRMKAAGMTHASVGTGADNVAAIALYRFLGFEDHVMSTNLVKRW
jgi:ribosomal protein S18 acetylase RimI-like enzyme